MEGSSTHSALLPMSWRGCFRQARHLECSPGWSGGLAGDRLDLALPGADLQPYYHNYQPLLYQTRSDKEVV